MKNEVMHTANSSYRCQYHIVSAPNYRRKVIFKQIRKDIGEILIKLFADVLHKEHLGSGLCIYSWQKHSLVASAAHEYFFGSFFATFTFICYLRLIAMPHGFEICTSVLLLDFSFLLTKLSVEVVDGMVWVQIIVLPCFLCSQLKDSTTYFADPAILL